MKKRILFVDDEPRILEGLQNLLRRHRHKWDMVFAAGGQAGLDRVDAENFDVVVSDMRMPGVDGAVLLRHVQEHHPDIVRIVLSGYTELESALRAVPVAHQFLTKPCNPALLENVVERACNLRALIGDEPVRRIVGKIEKLPSMPRIYAALTRALSDEKTSIADIAGILEQDIAMCAKLLQLVNSAFFRIAHRITNVEQAVTYLGVNMVKNLVLSVEVFDTGRASSRAGGLSIDELQSHSLFTAVLAARLLKDKGRAEDAFMAGMLHDIGKLVLAMELPEHMQKVLAASRQRGLPLQSVELEASRATHAEVGGYLLGLWGLPDPIVEAVANHHVPTRVPQRGFDVLAAVHIADALAHEATDVRSENRESLLHAPLDPGYLAQIGVEAQLDAWTHMAHEAAGADLPV